MKKIIIHGSTIGTNFGDCLLAQIFYKECQKANNGENLFYDNKFPVKSYMFELSPFYKKQLNYDKSCHFSDVLSCDGIVFMAGGYFGETHNSLKEAVVRYYRHIKLGLYAKLFKKPLAIIGVGAGPISHGFIRRDLRKISNYARVLAVRNDESKDFLESIGVNNSIEVTADIAQVITPDYANELPAELQENIKRIFGDRKIILLHCVMPLNEIQEIREKIIPGLKKFLDENDYGVIIANDQCDHDRSAELEDLSRGLGEHRSMVYKYHSPTEMIDLLNTVDLIVTTKLHIGIVGCSLNKAVVSFPFNSTKILRYYNQIGYGEHCCPIKDANSDIVFNMLKRFCCIPISLPKDVRLAAKRNLVLLREFIESI